MPQPQFGGPDYRDPAAGYRDPGHAGPGYGPGGGYQPQPPTSPQPGYQENGYRPNGFFAGGSPAGGPPAGGYQGSGYQGSGYQGGYPADRDGFRADGYPPLGGPAGQQQGGYPGQPGQPGQQPGGYGYPGQGPGGYPNAQQSGIGGQVPQVTPPASPVPWRGQGYQGQPAQPGQFAPQQPGAFGDAPPSFFAPAPTGMQQAQQGFQQGQPGGFAPGRQQGNFAAGPQVGAPGALPGSFPGQPGGYPNQPNQPNQPPGGFGGHQPDQFSRFGPAGFGPPQPALPAVAATVADGKAVRKNGLPRDKHRKGVLIGGTAAVVAVLAVGGVVVGPKLLQGSTDPGCKAYTNTALTAYDQAIGDLNDRATQARLTSDMPPAISDLTAAADQAKSASVRSALDGLLAELKIVSADVNQGSVPNATVEALNTAANSADHAC